MVLAGVLLAREREQAREREDVQEAELPEEQREVQEQDLPHRQPPADLLLERPSSPHLPLSLHGWSDSIIYHNTRETASR